MGLGGLIDGYLRRPPPTANKDGGLREQVEAFVAQWLRSGSGAGLTGSASGTQGQQLQALVDQLLGTTANAQTASLTGSLAQQIASAGRAPSRATGYLLYPSGTAAGTTVATPGGSFGSWTQIVASTAQADFVYGIALRETGVGGANNVHVQVGTGAAASEANAGEGFVPRIATNEGAVFYFRWPIAVASGTRLSARIAGSAALNYEVTLLYVPQSGAS